MNITDLLIIGNTVIITQDVNIDRDITIAENVTLIFEGGSLISSSSVSVTGNNTRVVAPKYKIFGDKINIEGSWLIDEAYPEWFGAIKYSTDTDIPYGSEQIHNRVGSTDAINKAIVMKQSGTVRLSTGFYMIDKPINLLTGIRLEGNNGELKDEVYKIDSNNKIKYISAGNTALYVHKNLWNGANHIIEINGNNSMAHTTITNLYIEYRNARGGNAGKPIGIKGIANMTIENIKSLYIPNLIVFDDIHKKPIFLERCYYSNWDSDSVGNNNDNGSVDWITYGFDFSQFKGLIYLNRVVINNGSNSTTRTNNFGLRLSSCVCATITSSIPNCNSAISDIDNLYIAGNHIEYGIQMNIKNSSIMFDANYIEKSENITLAIYGDKCYNQIILNSICMPIRSMYNTKTSFNFNDEENGKEFNKIKNIISRINQYEIAINKNLNAVIKNTYRYWLQEAGFGSTSPCGIKFQNIDLPLEEIIYNGSPIDQLNDESNHISIFSVISSYNVMNIRMRINQISNITQSRGFAPSIFYWLKGTEENPGGNIRYTYKYQIVYNIDRHIVGDSLNQILDPNSPLNINPTYKSKITAGTDIKVPLHSIIRYIRIGESTPGNKEYWYVDVPAIGDIELFDDGISLNGYRWIPTSANNINIQASTTQIIKYSNYATMLRIDADSNVLYNTNDWTIKDLFFIKDESTGNRGRYNIYRFI